MKDSNSQITEFISDQDRKNIDFMLIKVKEDYNFYNQATYELKKDYRFINESILSCLSKVNNDEKINTALRETKSFLSEVNKYSESTYRAVLLDNKDKKTIGVRDIGTPKIKKLIRK